MTCDDMEFEQDFLNLCREKQQSTNMSSSLPIGTNVGRAVVKVIVSDQGVGIPKAHFSNLFKPYTQINAGAIQKNAGTGLGLSLSKSIIELHSGTVGFDSVEGQGSDFSFTIPMELHLIAVDAEGWTGANGYVSFQNGTSGIAANGTTSTNNTTTFTLQPSPSPSQPQSLQQEQPQSSPLLPHHQHQPSDSNTMPGTTAGIDSFSVGIGGMAGFGGANVGHLSLSSESPSLTSSNPTVPRPPSLTTVRATSIPEVANETSPDHSSPPMNAIHPPKTIVQIIPSPLPPSSNQHLSPPPAATPSMTTPKIVIPSPATDIRTLTVTPISPPFYPIGTSPSPAAMTTSPLRILVVEDSHPNRKVSHPTRLTVIESCTTTNLMLTISFLLSAFFFLCSFFVPYSNAYGVK